PPNGVGDMHRYVIFIRILRNAESSHDRGGLMDGFFRYVEKRPHTRYLRDSVKLYVGDMLIGLRTIVLRPQPLPARNGRTPEQDDAMSGNICRCGTYVRIREAIKQAAQSTGQGGRP